MQKTLPRMFASFKRFQATSHATAAAAAATTATGTEKDSSSADYADLEKRADGRWSVQNRSGTLKVAIGTVHTDTDAEAGGKATGFLPARVGVLLFTMCTLIISGVLIGTTGMDIARNGEPLGCLRGAEGWRWADSLFCRQIDAACRFSRCCHRSIVFRIPLCHLHARVSSLSLLSSSSTAPAGK